VLFGLFTYLTCLYLPDTADTHSLTHSLTHSDMSGLSSLVAAAAAQQKKASLALTSLALGPASFGPQQEQEQEQAVPCTEKKNQQDLIIYICEEWTGPVGENSKIKTMARKIRLIQRYFDAFPFEKASLLELFTARANMLAFLSIQPNSSKANCLAST